MIMERHDWTFTVRNIMPEHLANMFMRVCVEWVEELLQTVVSLGQAREVEAGRIAA